MKNLFNFDECIAKDELIKYDEPWKIVPHISDIIEATIKKININDYNKLGENIFIHKTCKADKTVHIEGPCIICEGTELRHCAFIRGSVLIGKNCVIGNSCEIKNSIIFNEAQIPHFNYVGDSIVGYRSHLGAGAITSNLKSDKTLVEIKNGKDVIKTNLDKLGALIGDDVEVGCNSVLNPGTIVGKNTTIYPLSFVRGVIKENSIFKNANNIVEKTKKI